VYKELPLKNQTQKGPKDQRHGKISMKIEKEVQADISPNYKSPCGFTID
jgi:hypothetical protein